jgi:peroxiredoxin
LPSTIEQVHRTHGERGLAVLAVNIEERRETVAAWVRRAKVTMPVLLDPSGQVTRSYGVTGTPTAFLVGRDGKLVARAVGTKPWTGDKGRKLLERLLAGT